MSELLHERAPVDIGVRLWHAPGTNFVKVCLKGLAGVMLLQPVACRGVRGHFMVGKRAGRRKPPQTGRDECGVEKTFAGLEEVDELQGPLEGTAWKHFENTQSQDKPPSL